MTSLVSVLNTNSTVKPVHNDLPWGPEIVAVVARRSYFRAYLWYKSYKWGLKMVVVIERWLLFEGSR